MMSSVESSFDSYVSFNVFCGLEPKVCVCAGKKEKTSDHKDNMSTLSLKSLVLIACCFDFKM